MEAFEKIKKPAAPYSRTGGSRTTLGEEALDFRVRNGNGYDNLSVATGKNRKAGKLKRTATLRGAIGISLLVKSKK